MAEKAKKEKEEGVPKSKKNLLLFGALAVVLMVLAGVIVYLLMASVQCLPTLPSRLPLRIQ